MTTTVPELMSEAERQVPVDARPGTRHRAAAVVATAQARFAVEVVVRIDHRGRRRAQHFCDGVRLPHALLLRLTCAETACPEARAVQARWAAHHGRAAPAAARDAAQTIAARPLIDEWPLSGASGLACVARPARWPCFTACPNGAHPPMCVEQAGFDLFEDGGCVAGGLAVGADGRERPRLPSLAAAEGWLRARALEARALIDAAAGRVC